MKNVKENTQNSMLAGIKANIKAMSDNGLPFMQGREKGEVDADAAYTIVDFGFMKDQDKKYIAFIVKEDDAHFFFGGQVMTDLFLDIEEQYSSYLPALLEEGIPVKFGTKTSKNKRKYTTVEIQW